MLSVIFTKHLHNRIGGDNMENSKNIILTKGTLKFYVYYNPYNDRDISIRTLITSQDDLLGIGLSKRFVEGLSMSEREDLLESINARNTFEIYELYPGKTFISYVDQSIITNNDGFMSQVFVDGYISNLGLLTPSFCQGEFLVDRKTWLKICNEHDIRVNWANNRIKKKGYRDETTF